MGKFWNNLNKHYWTKYYARRKEGPPLFSYTTQNWHWFTCTRCSSFFWKAPYVQIEIGYHVKGDECFLFVWVLLFFFLPYRPQPLNWEQLLFVLCVSQSLFLSCIEIGCSSSNSVFSLIKQAHHGSVVRTGYKPVRFQLPQLINMVVSRRFNPLWTMIATMFQKNSDALYPHFRANSKKICSKFSCHFIDFGAVLLIYSALQRNAANDRAVARKKLWLRQCP